MERKGFSVFKGADGAYRWITISSSAFMDRDGEIITEKALADDVERCDTTKVYGPLRWWHIGNWEAPDGLEHWDSWKAGKGVDLGQCDFNMLHGKMLIESGTFKDELTGKAFSEIQDNLEVSIAFAHPIDQPGTTKQYNHIHRFERSLLPSGMASNLLTKAYVMKGEVNMKTSEKLAALVAILKGKPELAQSILADAASIQKAAEDAGLEYKEVSEMISGEVPTEQPEVVPPVALVPEVTPPADAPVVETKAAPAVPAPPPEPVEIGDWTPEQLTTFIVRVMQASMAKKEADDSARQQALNDALLTIKSQSDQITALDHVLKETQQSLLELTDSRPVGVKQLQASRPTESSSNVVANVASGPQFDPDFMKFMRGGN